jgi:C1A family cysteine protease
MRFQIFKKNIAVAAELDSRSELSSYGVTKFSDLSPEEFASRYLMKNFKRSSVAAPLYSMPTEPLAYPTSFDWSAKNALTPVYNQGQCGSCWAFSATENIESMNFLAGNNLTSLSMQQIVSCDTYDGGCGGGNPYTAYQYVMQAGGIEAYVDYPYTSGDGDNGVCRFDAKYIEAEISNWQYVTQDRNENAMQAFTYTTGPPSICVDASTWSGYQGGVITTSDGCGTALDHCVQLAGWTVFNGVNAWVVRNSWGTEWGYSGYLYVQMGSDVCGIAQEVTSVII